MNGGADFKSRAWLVAFRLVAPLARHSARLQEHCRLMRVRNQEHLDHAFVDIGKLCARLS
jgi:hypothetical protein